MSRTGEQVVENSISELELQEVLIITEH